ncbi:MAG: zinc-dependent metalloprotease family protein [Phycisphaerales bacterium]
MLIVASDQARFVYGSENAFVSDAMAMIADLNLRLSASAVDLRARLADADWDLIDGYAEIGGSALGNDLRELTYPANTNLVDAMGNIVYTTTDTASDAVLTQRDLYRPDLIHLITATGTGVGCVPADTTDLTPGAGFAVSSIGLAVPNGTFAHEVGHNLGACHNANSSAPSCAGMLTGTERGIEGFCDVPDLVISDDREVRTTMAYQVNENFPSLRLQRFSFLGLTYFFNNGLGSCAVPLFAPDALVNLTFDLTRDFTSQYEVASSQMWVRLGSIGFEGTRFAPFGSIQAAVNAVQGDVGEATVQVEPGSYNVGSLVIDKPVTIRAFGGPVVLQ